MADQSFQILSELHLVMYKDGIQYESLLPDVTAKTIEAEPDFWKCISVPASMGRSQHMAGIEKARIPRDDHPKRWRW